MARRAVDHINAISARFGQRASPREWRCLEPFGQMGLVIVIARIEFSIGIPHLDSAIDQPSDQVPQRCLPELSHGGKARPVISNPSRLQGRVAVGILAQNDRGQYLKRRDLKLVIKRS